MKRDWTFGSKASNCLGAGATIATAEVARIAVASQPMGRWPPTIVYHPIVALFEAMSIIIVMTGTATTALITALKRALS
jgi:hypothetical protein